VLTFSQGTPQKDDLTAVLIKRVSSDNNMLPMLSAD
jgi:hypothetical protein